MNLKNDVITAIATAPGQGAIGIIRLSGDNVLEVLKKVFVAKASIHEFVSHRMYYGEIVFDGRLVDEVMVCPMLTPRSFTGEDTVEIYAHGGMLVLNEVLKAVLKSGARLAENGEFSKRAFLNGRLNLSQAEAVMDIISAGSLSAKNAGLRLLGGGLTNRINKVRDNILSWIAHIELSIDYPEHEEEAKNAAAILSEVDNVEKDLTELMGTAKIGRIFREGIKTAIIGRPNVGKSTLLNTILSEDRAIVHEQAGTTRDVLTEQVRVHGLHLVIMDTAGIRSTIDPIEKIGVEKSIKTAQEADLILYIADATKGLTNADEDILKELKNPLIIMNKADLTVNCDESFIFISAKTGQGITTLFAQIAEKFNSSYKTSLPQESDIITRERHRILIEKAVEYIEEAKKELINKVPEDLVSISLRTAYLALGEILGEETDDDIVDKIFEEFCLGK